MIGSIVRCKEWHGVIFKTGQRYIVFGTGRSRGILIFSEQRRRVIWVGLEQFELVAE